MSEPNNIVIVGAGGLGREVLATITARNQVRKEWNVLGFLDSDRNLAGSEIGGVPVLGGDDWGKKNPDDSICFVCAVGNPRIRCQIVEKFSAMGCQFASVLHPDVQVPDSVRVGVGTVIMAGTRFTTDA